MLNSFLKKINEKLSRTEGYSALTAALAEDRFPIEVEGAKGGFRSWLISRISRLNRENLLVVLPTLKEAEALAEDLKLFQVPAVLFPEREGGVYSGREPSLKFQGKRMAALTALALQPNAVVVTSVGNLYQPVVPKSVLLAHLISLSVGMSLNPVELERQLSHLGYIRVPKVSLEGEFSIKGEVLDLFMPNQSYPLRFIYEWDCIEAIRSFDPVSFVPLETFREVTVIPAKTAVWDEERTEGLARYLDRRPTLEADRFSLLSRLGEGLEIPNESFFYYLSFPKIETLADYLSPKALLLISGSERCSACFEGLQKEWNEGYTAARREKSPAPPPGDLLIPPEEAVDSFPRRLFFYDIKADSGRSGRIAFDTLEPISCFGNIPFLKQEIGNFLSNGYDCFLFAESPLQQGRIQQLLHGFDLSVLSESISEGFIVPKSKLVVLNDREIFSRKKRVPLSVKRVKSRAIDTFVELEPGDYVVHVNYGIGRFESIERVNSSDHERDYIQIEFADDEHIFIPVEQVNLIQKYIGNEGSPPHLDRIGSKSWQNRKTAARKSVEELAKQLLEIYAKRREAKGFAFSRDTEWQVEFEAKFPYEETPDQLQCIEEVKADMESERPMDRLICGDVGFGKTEVALRAAFKAVVDGRQVAFLAPTTILAEQHYQNALERFEGFPVRIEMVSRFVPPAKIKAILEALKKGEIDLIIGTHRLLSQDMVFKNLGLLIIDEEQRFGVKHKERLKAMKASIDCLALSATPIPRTLHMSLLQIRDMSLLTTPPYNRRPIETHIQPFNEAAVAAAIRTELKRDGQVFYLHNRIETLETVYASIEKWVPEATVRMAHGRMNADELESIMHDFVHGNFRVLLATTIIENGIHIPNVNTIIIDRADRYGISQLYQLRGRVGRSAANSYAYLFYPDQTPLSEIAVKRLQIISDNTDLGAGFRVAMKDLEVRGAGNLLGREQSGQIAAVGYDLYLRMLEETVAQMSGKEREFGDDIVLDLVYSGFIPDRYISDTADKMSCYKKIASVQTDLELAQVTSEIGDRFGPLPNEVQSLLSLAEIRILCRKLFIGSLRERDSLLQVTFEKVHLINTEKVIRMLQENPGRVSYHPNRPHMLFLKTDCIALEEKSEFIRDVLSRLL